MYTSYTGEQSQVIVHVDVGTQALGGAIHNVDRGKVPVLIYAGASPFAMHCELKGSRNEWIMWMQDTHDQTPRPPGDLSKPLRTAKSDHLVRTCYKRCSKTEFSEQRPLYNTDKMGLIR
ncbi:hypothetical protein BDV98DRAFT_565796 [Pterulicium gracile]|uniref:Uncharacterized protein n=1 Tax=Pterulicium gracile TaxID=1884261 RepID=A0A5C3QM61_9AGAR|nr:hypothetical protein BDV98DRAFT_565796 [Pterula gracilis]